MLSGDCLPAYVPLQIGTHTRATAQGCAKGIQGSSWNSLSFPAINGPSAKLSKEEVVTLPSSKHFRLCLNSFNGILWFKLQSRNTTAAGDWKMQITYMFGIKKKHTSESAKKVKYIHSTHLYDNSKIGSLKTIFLNIGGNYVQSENIPWVL